MSHKTENYTKYIPRGFQVQPDGEFVYSEAIGVRLTPNDDVALLELTQDSTDGPQAISLSPSQAATLVEVLKSVKITHQD